MLRAVLLQQWRVLRWGLLVFSVLAFAVPVITTAAAGGLALGAQPVLDVISTFSVAGVPLAFGALLLGITVGSAGWGVDQNLGNVYLLVHPVPRWYMVLLRFASGLLLLALPVGALLVGNVAVTLLGSRPPYVQAYPVAQALRFALVSLVIYGVLFGASALAVPARDEGERARKVLLGLAATGVVVALVIWADGALLGDALGRRLSAWLEGPWSPVRLLLSRWGLYDI
jgi:hypothetical protein